MAGNNPHDAGLIKAMLVDANENPEITCVDRFSDIVAALEKEDFSALILDINLPDQSGVENISQISNQFPDLPLVVMTGASEMGKALASLRSGAQDYLLRDEMNPSLLVRSLRYARERKIIEQELRLALKATVQKNQELERLSRHDPLTGLPNRRFFDEAAAREIEHARQSGNVLALLYFDIAGFKKVNDVYGHAVGDRLLREVTDAVGRKLADEDTLARIGGDEFVILTRPLDSPAHAYPIATRVIDAIRQPFLITDWTIEVSANVGIATFPQSGSLELLVRHADIAMSEAKKKRDHFPHFYTRSLERHYHRLVCIERALPASTLNDEIRTVCQPVIAIGRPGEVGLEALSRWQSPDLGVIAPDEFIPIAESAGFANDILSIGLRNVSEMLRGFNLKPNGRLSFNVAPVQLLDCHFTSRLLDQLAGLNLNPHQLCVEITERELVQNIAACDSQLRRLREAGIAIALDDFGTGFSSIAHLVNLPIDILKIDRSLIDGIDTNPKNQALTAGIIEMAHRLGLTVTAEGVEREEELTLLTGLECDRIQGYLITRPLEPDAFAGFLANFIGPVVETE